jgi:hypothetical protein
VAQCFVFRSIARLFGGRCAVRFVLFGEHH